MYSFKNSVSVVFLSSRTLLSREPVNKDFPSGEKIAHLNFTVFFIYSFTRVFNSFGFNSYTAESFPHVTNEESSKFQFIDVI